MLRYRRYRVFLVFTIFAIAALYRFTTVQEWESATTSSVEKLKEYAGQSYKGKTVESPASPPEITRVEGPKAKPTHLSDKVEAAIPKATGKPVGEWELGSKETPIKKAADKTKATRPAETPATPGRHFGLSGQSRLDAPPPLRDGPEIHWERLPEHFPVPDDRIIPLPSGKPISMPKIQHNFKDETPTEKSEREKKQSQIKAAFEHSWKGYRDHAWMYDELKPMSGANRNTFCGWGATLVDALDTLWIMGLKNEFENATLAVAKIDFTTTTRTDIPLFETTIRYLGGLLAAYDISEAKYEILLKKAQELGDILLAAFDTPNRMPITYYNWRPTFAKNPHRAGTRTVLAELGSLSMEFTRLAQLTKENKYYDAVARITNELELMQSKTRVPGLWPEKIDTSGCQKPPSPSPQDAIHQHEIANQARLSAMAKEPITPEASNAKEDDPETKLVYTKNFSSKKSTQLNEDKAKQKRQLNTDDNGLHEVPKALQASVPEAPALNSEKTPADSTSKDKAEVDKKLSTSSGPAATAPESSSEKKQSDNVPPNPIEEKPATPDPRLDRSNQREKVDCLAQGLTSPPNSFSETFKFGGASDSTYEYLPKMHLLTGGLVPQYSKMYEKAIDAANELLLFRPMIPESDRKLLVVGSAEVRQGYPEYPGNFTLNADQSHLLCFTGGMWGMGAKLFNRDKDFEIAKQITDGCVWAYESTASGIMPETMQLIACPSQKECAWNETLWKEIIDPFWRERDEQRLLNEQQMEEYAAEQAASGSETESTNTGAFRVKTSAQDTGLDTSEQPTEGPLSKRDLDSEASSASIASEAAVVSEPELQELETYNPWPTHDEFVKTRMKDTRLPRGVPGMYARHYILRPEAIESVFIMYRMTGDEYWRQKGWKMWEAIERETKAEFGHSAIKDVTRKNYEYNKNDEMESFWLAETLKYFYLLFSAPDTVSLDDWVLNTEAHPFKRPR